MHSIDAAYCYGRVAWSVVYWCKCWLAFEQTLQTDELQVQTKRESERDLFESKRQWLYESLLGPVTVYNRAY